MYDVIYQYAMDEPERVLRVEKGFVNAVVAKVNPRFQSKMNDGEAAELVDAVGVQSSDRTSSLADGTCTKPDA
jgi:hypothetical protein